MKTVLIGNPQDIGGATGGATETTLVAILAKIIASPATETTLASILAKLIANPATEATMASLLASLGASSDAAATGNGSAIALLKQLRALYAGGLPAALGQTTMANSLAVTLASNQSALPVSIANGSDAAQGSTTDAEATGNGSTIAVLKRLRTLLNAGLPAAPGQTAMANSLAVTLASNQSALAVDSELPAAAALADAASLPTAPSVGAAGLLYNGATLDLQRGNIELSPLTSAARTTTTNSSDITLHNARGAYAVLNVTAASGTGGLTLRWQGKDPVSGTYVNLNAAPTAIVAIGSTVYLIYPGPAVAPQ